MRDVFRRVRPVLYGTLGHPDSGPASERRPAPAIGDATLAAARGALGRIHSGAGRGGFDMGKVFVSYSRADAARIDELYRDLESLGHDAWLDRDLTGGQRWWDRILQSIRECDTFVLALSGASLESRACQSELEYATALGKPVLPVLVERNVSDSLMPPSLAQLQRVDYTQADKAAFAALNRGLTTMPAAPPLPAELPPEPEVPASYLFDLRTEIEATGALAPERQDELLTQLRARLDQGHAPEDLRALAERLRRRPDVLARVDRELGAFEERLAAVAGERASAARTPAADTMSEPAPGGAAAPPPAGVPPARPSEDVPPQAAPEPRQPNAVAGWWWAVAVIFAFVGGVVAYFANRDVDPKTARNMLIVGIVMTFVWPVLLSGG